MKHDLFLDLWETRPKLAEKRNEETFETYKEVILDANNTPVIEKRHRGILKLNLSEWVNKAELKATGEENTVHLKMAFYDP